MSICTDEKVPKVCHIQSISKGTSTVGVIPCFFLAQKWTVLPKQSFSIAFQIWNDKVRSDAGQGGVIGRGWLQDSEWGPGDPSNNQHTHSLLSFDDEDDGVPISVRGVRSAGMIWRHVFDFLLFLETHAFMVFGERSSFWRQTVSPFDPIPDSGIIDGDHLHFLKMIVSSSIEWMIFNW